MQPTGPSNSAENRTETDAITDNLALLEELLPKVGLARMLLQARRLAPDDPTGLRKVIDKRLEQLSEDYAEASDQVD